MQAVQRSHGPPEMRISSVAMKECLKESNEKVKNKETAEKPM